MTMARRLHALNSHLSAPDGQPLTAVGTSGAPPRAVVEAAGEKKFSDAQLKQFLSQGYMIVPVADLDTDFHEGIYLSLIHI